MKNRSFISILSFLFAAMFGATSCSDMLTPDLERYANDTYAQDSVYSAFGILKSIQKIGVRTVVLDEVRSDLATIGTYTTDSIKSIANFENPEDGSSAFLNVADYYHIINSCNFYLARVDTVSTKNGVAEMKREATQIEAIRAWTYLQLVRLYGSVPYVTEPISDAKTAKELAQSAPRVTKDNLIDFLVRDGLEDALAQQKKLGLPSYGNINNGSTSYATRYMFFPIQLILADAYLLKNNYEKAAENYYDFFYYVNHSNNNISYRCSASAIYESGFVTGYTLNSYNWLNYMRSFNSNEVLSMTIGAARSQYGLMLTDLQNVFGFQTTSSASSSGSASPGETYQQILPSENYITLNEDQKFCRWVLDNNVITIEYVEGVGDGRLYGTAPYYEFERGQQTPIIDKFCTANSNSSLNSAGSFSINYMIPLYRQAQVWLRYAEAINRMGFPELAFGILKDGLIRENYPTLRYHDTNVYAADSVKTDSIIGVVVNGDTLLYADGATPDSTKLNTPYFSEEPQAYNGGMYYLSVDEMQRSSAYNYLNFTSNDMWSNTSALTSSYSGIHSRGCGDTGGTHDTIYTYARMVAKKIAENYARQNSLTYDQQMEYENTLHSGDTLLVTDQNLIINAVEDLIIDESALETAFEGHRFSDLLRFADHKTAAGVDGTSWLAWKIARRDLPFTSDASQVDATLFSKLQNQSYWYFALPTEQ